MLSNREKCAIIAEAFRCKFEADGGTETDIPRGGRDGRPLGPYRRELVGAHKEVTVVEVRRAVRTLAPGKTPGPDGLPGGAYKNLPILIPHLTRLMNLIYRTGAAPKPLRRVYLVPIPKPGRDPYLLSARRPISLLCSAAKVIEAVLYHRMMPVIGPKLAPQQYAYRRGRGTEQHLTELMDFVHRSLYLGRHCFLISFDISGAFDNVSHRGLMQGLERMNVDGHTCRVVHSWRRDRSFQLKMRTPAGVYFSDIHQISRGLPQ